MMAQLGGYMSEYRCDRCGNEVNPARYEIGYTTCKPCGEKRARAVKHTVLPLHKSNYMVPANREEIMGFNNKGGFYR
jgi:DNA-directed RNA polymerase subunit RPC12/RpoP